MLRDEACRVQPQVRGKGVQAELRSKVEVPEHDLCALIDVFMPIAKEVVALLKSLLVVGGCGVCVLILILIAVLMK